MLPYFTFKIKIVFCGCVECKNNCETYDISMCVCEKVKRNNKFGQVTLGNPFEL